MSVAENSIQVFMLQGRYQLDFVSREGKDFSFKFQ